MIRAMGGGTVWVFSTQLLLVSVPHEVRGRVFATEYALLTLAMAGSAALGGFALDRVGLRETTIAAAALMALTMLAVRMFRPGLTDAIAKPVDEAVG